MARDPEQIEGELFSGVRFVLFGFDSVSEAQYRSELVRRGGVDVGRYDSDCTHVIVFGRVHDDQVCVAARKDGKILVTELWIEDSVDFSELANPSRLRESRSYEQTCRFVPENIGLPVKEGLLVSPDIDCGMIQMSKAGAMIIEGFRLGNECNASRFCSQYCVKIMYKPVKDLSGIPGSQSLIICLTGYQRRERDDIMKMVDLMGANFSKPLIASKVTHLVCYKFEGEKYELANRVNIKLVNHQWLEDCLREWKILPEENYKMSSWELEIMKAEAKNSDDETEGYSNLRPVRKRNATAENKDILQGSTAQSTGPINPIIKQEILPPKPSSSPFKEQNVSSDASHLPITDNITEEFNHSRKNELPANADESKSISPNCRPAKSPRNLKDCAQKSAFSADCQSPSLRNSLPLKRKVPGLKNYSILPTSSPATSEKSPASRVLSEKRLSISAAHASSRDFSSPDNSRSLVQQSESSKDTGSSSSIKNNVASLGVLSIENSKADAELPSDKADVIMSDVANQNSEMGKSADSNSNSTRRVHSKALIKRVVAKRKMSSASKPSSELSSKLERETDPEKKVSEVSSGTVEMISAEKISPQSVNGKSPVEPDCASSVAQEPQVYEKTEKANSLNVNDKTKGKLRSAHRLALAPSSDEAEKENKSTEAPDCASTGAKEHPVNENGENVKPSPVNASGKLRSSNRLAVALNSGDTEKENKSAGSTRKKDKSVEKSSQRQIIPDPSWFILSGHRLQRKEFQKIIKRLRGRVCRDSHSWSYQATHFIAPDPLRRTEKFFAAAASGRWILKSDYLGACNEAGKFVAEEAFEWAGGGLTQDGAISLEAPRKWRLLRERTGHGVFHGTRVVIYGECIAPSLDTLKRVVKAGDGDVLATSPPYTRALNAGIDFAVISAGTPRGDPWVEEFLKREIPCVVSDYLVELVCKPGYPLDRHVLYGSHSFAEKALSELIRRRE